MKIFMKMSKFYISFLIPPKKWSRPQKADILVYDYESLEALLPYVNKYSHSVMAVRGESINLYCAILSILTLDFWTTSAFNAYINKYISLVSPKVIITFIDNDVRFYEISSNFPLIKTIFVQNGRRTILRDVFATLSHNKKYHVDYMLVFNKSVGELYSSFISGTVIPIGSLKNNSVTISNNFEKNTVLFISTIGPYPSPGMPYLIESNGRKIDWTTFHAIDKLIIDFLDEWCYKNNKQLKVLGRTFGNESDEHLFYLNNLNKCKWEYVPRQGTYSSYQQIDISEIIVFIDSTLGYEALSRRKKTAAFICRANFLNSQSERFGWPAKKDETGPYWTHELDVAIFSKIMDFLSNLDNIEWDSVLKEHDSGLMYFDQDNLELQNLLKNLL
jgi:surface carbohydrate biosynthesis protein